MKPKIPKLTKKERRMWIKALRELLNYYKEESGKMDRCSLCIIADNIMVDACENTYHCPWYWFTGCSCGKFANKKKFVSLLPNLRIQRIPRWVKMRTEQISQWIKKLEEDL